ncbi:hypothetical protein [Dyadobacter sp. 3J3]|uniref:hypothetical protein n=1 Tax=Dyadobacter sp. 3J3 TaxID=2606600 RepID=UPI00135A88E7|nr:hypothetical protein [Dyadobacter sp. 3J3]
MKTKHLLLLFLSCALLAISDYAFAQVKIGDSPTIINGGSALEIESTNRGLLMPRISLTNTTTWGLLGTAAAGMHVYNTNTGITSTNTTYPTLAAKIGEYYWDGTGWVALAPYGSQLAPVQVKVSGISQTLANAPVNNTNGPVVRLLSLASTAVFDTGNNKSGNTIVIASAGLYDINSYSGFVATGPPGGWGLRLWVNNADLGQFTGGVTTTNASDAGTGRILTRLNAGDVVDFRMALTQESGTFSVNNGSFSVIKVSN